MAEVGRIDGTLRRQLGHLVSQTTRLAGTGTQTTSSYRLYPITLTRPAGGRALIQVFCPTCQKNLGVIVSSEAETLRYRDRCGRKALIGLLGLLVLAPVAILLILHGGLECFATLVIFGVIFSFFFAFFNARYWVSHEGVFWHKETSPALRKGHKIMPADVHRRSYKVPFGPRYGPSQ
jgi:hypothetical protein